MAEVALYNSEIDMKYSWETKATETGEIFDLDQLLVCIGAQSHVEADEFLYVLNGAYSV